MQIKQLVLVIILILSLIGFLMPSIFAAEVKTDGLGARDVSIEATNSIRVDNPGILQTNPFYFVKEWGRGIYRVFTFNPISKLQYDFQVVTDKAAELKRLEEIGVADKINLRAAVLNYSDSLKPLGARLRSADIKAADILDDLISKTSKQEQLLEELKSRHSDLKSDIDTAKSYLDQILEVAFEKLDGAR